MPEKAQPCDSEPKLDDWRSPSPKQMVSNRSILRIQELSYELKNQLNMMSLFESNEPRRSSAGTDGSIASVLFVARDHGYEIDPSRNKEKQRWYNFRLCASYDFPIEKDKNKQIHHWIASTENEPAFRELFKIAKDRDPDTAADFKRFWLAVNNERDSNRDDPPREAIDQLLIALAVIPYRGVLPELFESLFDSSEARDECYLFYPATEADGSIKFENNETVFCRKRLQHFDRILSDGEIETLKQPPLVWHETTIDGKLGEFLLRLTRGEKDPRPQDETGTVNKNKDENLVGISIPAYDIWNKKKGGWRGGMAGWVVLLVKRHQLSNLEQKLAKGLTTNERKSLWDHFTDLIRTYVRRVREAQMRDLLEDYASMATPPAPRTYFRNWLQEIIGWRAVESSNVKLRVLLDEGQPEIVDVEPLRDTNWVTKWREEDPDVFPTGTERLCKLFLEELKLIHQQRELGRDAGKLAGFVASAHDYSKEVGGIGTRLNRFNQMLEEVNLSIQEQTKRLSTSTDPASSSIAAAIDRQLKRLDRPRLDWFSQLQFNHAHLQTQTTSILIQEPTSCIALLENGTLSDITELVRILVWLPLDYGDYKELERQTRVIQTAKLHDPATWCLLFSYDLASSHTLHQKLGKKISRLILEEQITEDTFFARFPIPQVNPGDEPAKNLLWESLDRTAEGATRRRRLRPLDRLLPLFVFSLRFAFQCAWARTLLREGDEAAERILISATSPTARQHRICIQFPFPDPDASNVRTALDSNEIPYLKEWQTQINHYDGLTGCWQIENKLVTPDERGRLNLFLRATP